MYISFGRRLRGFGNMRVGFRMSTSQGCLFACIYGCINAMIYLFWYMILACFWMVYGIGYVFYYLPIKAIINLCKDKKAKGNSYVANHSDSDKT